MAWECAFLSALQPALQSSSLQETTWGQHPWVNHSSVCRLSLTLQLPLGKANQTHSVSAHEYTLNQKNQHINLLHTSFFIVLMNEA